MITIYNNLVDIDEYTRSDREINDKIIEMIDLTFRTLAIGKNMIRHYGGIQWIMTLPRGGIERIYSVKLNRRNAEREISSLVRSIQAQSAPNALIVTPHSTPENLSAILLAHGFLLQDEVDWAFGMGLRLDKWSPKILPRTEVEIHSVASRQELSAWIAIVNQALFGRELMSVEEFDCLRKIPKLQLYLAYYASLPAGVCWALYSGDLVDVNYVATLREQRGKGIASSLICHALLEAKTKGTTLATLSGEASAMPVYEKIGYRKYFPIKEYRFVELPR